MDAKKLRRYYIKTIELIHRIYNDCKLVHADLSEYNLLINKHELYVIDVGQAVDLKHPKAAQYLRRDIKIVSNFFEKALKKINVKIGQLSEEDVYELVTCSRDEQLDDEEEDLEESDKADEVESEQERTKENPDPKTEKDSHPTTTKITIHDILIQKMESILSHETN